MRMRQKLRIITIMMKKIKEYALFVFGILLIMNVIYNRFIRVRLPKELPTEFDILRIIILLLLILGAVIALYINIKKILKIEPKENTWLDNPIIKRWLEILAIPQKALDSVIKVWFDVMPTAADITDKVSKLFLNLSERKLSCIYIGCVLLPKTVIALVFFTDVCILNYLENFYKVLPIITLSLVIRCIVHIIKCYGEQFARLMEKYINVIRIEL